jgi:cobalt-zinc-cadmium efflux system outer membrane protein
MKFFMCLLITFTITLYLPAQETPPPLTLQDAITAARANHPALKAAANDVIAASANLTGASILRNPEIIIAPSILGKAGSDSLLSVVQSLELNGARKARTKIASGQLETMKAELLITEKDVVLAVQKGYWMLAQAQALVAFDMENVIHAETLLATAKKQVELGNEPESHIIKAELELARIQQQLTGSKNAALQAQSTLNAYMGRDSITQIKLADALTYNPVILDDKSIFQKGIANRPELLRDQALVAIALGEKDAIRAENRADLSIQLRQESWDGNGGVGISLSLPIFDWGSANADFKRSEANIVSQRYRMESTRLTVRQEIDSAMIAANNAETQIIMMRDKILKPAEKLAQMTTIGYQEGAMTYLEVLEARRTMRTINAEYLAALGNYHIALAQLEWATGTNLMLIPVKEIKP